ncbi:uncharacterized protein KY384_004024 [Bacidia gigantensis]|uniref:uncharacterized protein n=1 Tax=Bacidia gigantensis TaxID=2732470 RepID=UPI001D03B99E|nr:uncharacterized protein KY384_004024 [Bacidia gigantensis]KAG8530669.1 hypothetical protein KY384_004024 [Bacidia gigantensis]
MAANVERSSPEPHEDVSPLTSDAESEDDPIARHARNSTEVAVHDCGILEEEEEREELLTARTETSSTPKFLSSKIRDIRLNGKLGRASKRDGYRKTRREEHGDLDENGELMYEMEEGGPHSEISSQASSSSAELDKLNLSRNQKPEWRKYAIGSAVIIVLSLLFIILTLGAYNATQESIKVPQILLSNGTSLFAPTTILISLDGFRADFLTRGITPTLNQFIAEGISPKYMYPSFPSVTFPNHFTLVTGLHPESHGIVGNTFWDPEFEAEFHYTDPSRSMQPKWWKGGEPIWVTAEKQNVKTGVHMWPGSEAGMEYSASYLDKFNGSELLSKKTDRILELLDLPSIEDSATRVRPQLIAAYVPNVDGDGHRYGPNSTEIYDTISAVDKMLHNIFTGLDERNLTSIVNVIVVSDHGMATTSVDRLVQLDDIIDVGKIEHIDGWPLYGLRPWSDEPVQELYDQLKAEADQSPNFDVYLRDKDMPTQFHFSQNPRIAPLWVIPKTGWAIVHKEDFDVKEAKASGQTYAPKGLHGYDHHNPLMRAIFVARGPAFPHKPNSRVSPFQNTEVYNILCDSLGIEPKANNGTLRLPLKPSGLHSDENQEEASDEIQDLPSSPTVEIVEIGSDGKPITVGETQESGNEESQRHKNKFFDYLKAKIAQAMQWASAILHGHKKPKDGPAEPS